MINIGDKVVSIYGFDTYIYTVIDKFVIGGFDGKSSHYDYNTNIFNGGDLAYVLDVHDVVPHGTIKLVKAKTKPKPKPVNLNTRFNMRHMAAIEEDIVKLKMTQLVNNLTMVGLEAELRLSKMTIKDIYDSYKTT